MNRPFETGRSSGMKFSFEGKEMLAYRCREAIEAAISDFQYIKVLCGAEQHRRGCLAKEEEKRAIIESRKNNAMRCIHNVCEDHLLYLEELMEEYWKVMHPLNKVKARKRNDKRRKS